MQIVDGTTPLLPTRAHLVALHTYHTQLLLLRVTALLRKLDAEHSCMGAVCHTCDWLLHQPEWVEVCEQREQEWT